MMPNTPYTLYKKHILCFLTIAISIISIFLSHTARAQTATWKSDAVSSDWNTSTNWVEGVVPTSTSDVVINTCTSCPLLGTNVTVNSLAINSGGGIDLKAYTLASTNIQIKYAVVNSIAGGKLLGSKINEIVRNTFKGAITLEKSGLDMNVWSGGNTFLGPVTIILNLNSTVSGYSYLRTGTYAEDVFYEDVEVKGVRGTGIAIGFNSTKPSVFKKKLTYTNYLGSHLTNVLCEGEVVLTVSGSGASIYTQTGVFSSSVTINVLPSNSTVYNDNVQFQKATFKGPVIINNTNTKRATNYALGVIFGINNSNCVFTPTSSLLIGPNGFHTGDLILDRSTFQNTTETLLDLSSGPPSSTARVGRLIIGTGTSFTGILQAKAPNIFLNGTTFNQEATFTKTGAGINNSVGGNTFKKKVTITNQADASSAINLATQANDIIKY